jgi:hypothetical protein
MLVGTDLKRTGVDTTELTKWLAQPKAELVQEVARCVREHVAVLRASGINFYGYAILSGELDDINIVAAAHNCEPDIKVPRGHEMYRYYRYSVDEWLCWDHDAFESVNRTIKDANARFASLHEKSRRPFRLDEFEVRFAESLLEAILQGMETAKAQGAFGDANPFLAIWISDSGLKIIRDSVRRLNPEAVSQEFEAEFFP